MVIFCLSDRSGTVIFSTHPKEFPSKTSGNYDTHYVLTTCSKVYASNQPKYLWCFACRVVCAIWDKIKMNAEKTVRRSLPSCMYIYLLYSRSTSLFSLFIPFTIATHSLLPSIFIPLQQASKKGLCIAISSPLLLPIHLHSSFKTFFCTKKIFFFTSLRKNILFHAPLHLAG